MKGLRGQLFSFFWCFLQFSAENCKAFLSWVSSFFFAKSTLPCIVELQSIMGMRMMFLSGEQLQDAILIMTHDIFSRFNVAWWQWVPLDVDSDCDDAEQQEQDKDDCEVICVEYYNLLRLKLKCWKIFEIIYKQHFTNIFIT